MAWETRPNGRKFFYHSYRKQDGSVGRKYYGSGKRARAKAKQIEEAKQSRRLEQAAIANWRTQLDTIQGATDAALKFTEDLIASWLLANGYWRGRNNDRKWRKWRVKRARKEECGFSHWCRHLSRSIAQIASSQLSPLRGHQMCLGCAGIVVVLHPTALTVFWRQHASTSSATQNSTK